MGAERYSLEEIAHHEAGHYVAAYVLRSWGYRFTLTIVPDDETSGHCKHELVEHDQAAAADDVVISFAGIEAQIRLPGVSRAAALPGACGDMEHVDEQCERWPELDRLAIKQRSAELVAQHWDMVTLLAAALLEHKTLSGVVADTICGLVDDPVSFEMAVRGLSMHGLLATVPADDDTGRVRVQVPRWLTAHYGHNTPLAAQSAFESQTP